MLMKTHAPFAPPEVQFDLEVKIDNKLLRSYIILIGQSSMILTLRTLEIHVKMHKFQSGNY